MNKVIFKRYNEILGCDSTIYPVIPGRTYRYLGLSSRGCEWTTTIHDRFAVIIDNNEWYPTIRVWE